MARSILPSLSRFVAYQLALELAELVYAIPVRGSRRDQLHRAMDSVVANTAEGNGESGVTAANRYFSIARGSLSEVASFIDLLLLRRQPIPDLEQIEALVPRLYSVLSGLIRRR